MKKGNYRNILMGVVFAALLSSAKAFVLMGPVNVNETAARNYTEGAGAARAAPKSIHGEFPRFYRWTLPSFVYSFDASFVNYFGVEGMDAVHDAMDVINDFFINDEYQGVSQLDLYKHGFLGNNNTSWINTTAQNAQIIDMKSLVLGMMVNHLGIGNPHRYAFTILHEAANTVTSATNYYVSLRNYDPLSHEPTDFINGVQYSYRLIHDGSLALAPTITDMEEFTTDTSGNAWSSVAAITEAFYGNTALYWTDTPSLFNFGVYYDGLNAMGGQYQPRHALTFDDAGGLKHLYSTNSYIYQEVDVAGAGVTLVEGAVSTPDHLRAHLPNPSGGLFPIFPRQQGGLVGALPTVAPAVSPFINLPGFTAANPQPSTRGFRWPAGAATDAGTNLALRGGIDSIQLYHQPFDSLLGLSFVATNFFWTDTFVSEGVNRNVGIADANGNQVGTLSANTPGVQWNARNPNMSGSTFYLDPVVTSFNLQSQKLSRSVSAPDMIFVADYLVQVGGVPVGFGYDRPYETGNVLNEGVNVETARHIPQISARLAAQNITELGPGTFTLPAAAGNAGGALVTPALASGGKFVYAFTKLHKEFEVLWSGEATVVGNQVGMSSLWGHIKGPGPDDYVTFPKGSTPTRILNSIIPDLSPPTISLVSDNGGAEPISEDTFTRTEETLTILGDEMASATAVEIMDNELVLQTIMPVDKYIISNGRLDIPAGILSDVVEGTLRQVRIWNSVGPSELSSQKFKIETGRPVITGTTSDGYVFDRATILTVNGYGFKSRTTGETAVDRIRLDNSEGQSVYDAGVYNSGANNGISDGIPVDVSAISGGIVVNSDTQLVLPIDAVSFRADGSNRRLRVARRAPTGGLASNTDAVLSPGTNPLFSAITSKPVLSSLSQNNATLLWEPVTTTGMYKRDRLLEINGTALNTATTIEIVQEDGTSFANPVFIQLPNAAATVDDNGTRIRIAGDAIPWADADTNSTSKRALKIYNAVANSDLNATLMFAVNTLPRVDAIGAFANAGYFNRDKTLGDDFVIFGSGFNGISQIVFTDDNDSSVDRGVAITLPAPGVTVTDSQISVDTQTLQVGSGADTDVNSSRRIVQLTSARPNANSPVSQRFYMGAPPAITSLAGTSNGNYTRDSDTISITGSGFGHVTSLDIVDALGNPIAGASGLAPGVGGTGGGLTINNATGLRVDPNATGWVNVAHLLDTVTASGRRMKITTPFGSITSATADAFTVSATPEFMASIQSTFAGGGYTADDPGDPDDDNGTYDRSEGDLVINGKNFRGVMKIEFYSGAGVSDGNFTIDPLNPPAGIATNLDGTQIVIASTTVPAAWTGGGTNNNATVNLVSVAGQSSGNSTISSTMTPIQAQD